MESKIQELTNKLLAEGVDKGKAEAEKIVAAAKEESANIVADAKQQAEAIVAAAKKDAETLDENTKSELKMYAGQALSALKTEVANVLTDASWCGCGSSCFFSGKFFLQQNKSRRNRRHCFCRYNSGS